MDGLSFWMSLWMLFLEMVIITRSEEGCAGEGGRDGNVDDLIGIRFAHI